MSKAIKKCPECEKVLIKPTECTMCGWKDKERPAPVDNQSRFQCSYHYQGRQCPLPGAHTVSVNGSKFWQCRWHANAKSTMERVEILDDIEKNGIPKFVELKDREIDNRIVKLGLVREPGESSQDFVKRCKEGYRKHLSKLDLSAKRLRDREAEEERRAIQEFQ